MQNRDRNDKIFQFFESLISFLIERNKISKEMINREAETGSP